jgi:hypothetical protein
MFGNTPPRRKIVTILLRLFLALCFLTACGLAPGQTISTSVPVPTGQAQPASIQPRVEPVTDQILFEDMPTQTYTHLSSQRFSIDYPLNWQFFEQANGVVFVDPTDRAGYRVVFSPVNTALAPEALRTFALQFVQDNFGDEDSFEILAQDEHTIRFKGTDANFGPAMNELSFLQDGELVYFVLITVVENQWAQAAEGLRDLAASLTFHPAPELTPTPSNVPPQWALYGHPTEKFAFLYPDTWQITEAEQSVVATLPERQFVFSVEVVSAPGAGQDPSIVESFTQEQADKLAQRIDDFQSLPLTPYQAGQGSGYTIDYLYTDETGLPIAGSIIATARGDKLYHISITAPALVYEEALVWFNPMLQSFQFLPDE